MQATSAPTRSPYCVYDLLALQAKRIAALPRSGRRWARNARGSRAPGVEKIRAVDEERDRTAGCVAGDARHDRAPLVGGHRVAGGVVGRVVQKDEGAPLPRQLPTQRGVERRDVEAPPGVEHLERLEPSLGLVAQRVVRAPVPVRGEEGLAGLEEVGEREAQRAGPAGGGRGDGHAPELWLPCEKIVEHRPLEGRGPGDGGVAGPLLGRDLVHGARGGRQDREPAVVVEEGPHGRVDDRLAALPARRRLLV